MSWIVISFYTIGTGYEQEIKKLESSLIKFNLPYKFFDYKPTGTWRGNLNYKSESILKAFDLFPDQDIVFLDADAIIREHPVLFDGLSAAKEYDAAAHFFQWYSFAKNELLSGTLWFQNNSAGRALVKRWHDLGLANPGKRHQECLKAAINETDKIYALPFEYTCIFDAPQRQGKPAVIEHFQASRKFRKQVGWGVDLIRQAKPKQARRRMIRTTAARAK